MLLYWQVNVRTTTFRRVRQANHAYLLKLIYIQAIWFDDRATLYRFSSSGELRFLYRLARRLAKLDQYLSTLRTVTTWGDLGRSQGDGVQRSATRPFYLRLLFAELIWQCVEWIPGVWYHRSFRVA